MCVYTARGEKKNIFLTYGANRFLLKCLDSFDKRFFFALHIFSYFFPFYVILPYTHSRSSLMRGCEEKEYGYNAAGDKQRRFFDNNKTVKFSSFIVFFLRRPNYNKSPHMDLCFLFVLISIPPCASFFLSARFELRAY